MKIDDLISVGSLGKSINKNGFFKYKSLLELPQESKLLNEVFLIFKDHRVRFVDVEFSGNNEDRIKITDLYLANEVVKAGGVKVALALDNINDLRVKNGLLPSGEMKIVFDGEEIGILIDIFDNNAHEILVVELKNGKEIMIPYVDYFVSESSNEKVIVKNIKDFLEL